MAGDVELVTQLHNLFVVVIGRTESSFIPGIPALSKYAFNVMPLSSMSQKFPGL